MGTFSLSSDTLNYHVDGSKRQVLALAMMTKDAKAILKELKAIHALLDTVVKQTAPKPGPDDFNPKHDYLLKLERKEVQPNE